jgi:hypothetical protein
MVLAGVGVGMTMPMLNLASQNAVPFVDMGTTTSTVGFARSMGSTLGIALFGAVFNIRLAAGLAAFERTGALPAGVDPAALVRDPTALNKLAPAVHHGVSGALASAIGDVYLVVLPIAVLCFLLAWCLREIPLRTQAAVTAPPPDVAVVVSVAPALVAGIEA